MLEVNVFIRYKNNYDFNWLPKGAIKLDNNCAILCINLIDFFYLKHGCITKSLIFLSEIQLIKQKIKQ